MGRDTLRYKVTCSCDVLYPNHPERKHQGRVILGTFIYKKLAEDFVVYCLNGYYHDVKIETDG